MVSGSWVLRVDVAVKEKVENWLKVEAKSQYIIMTDTDDVEIDFDNIDDAFRFRMQFDDELIN